MPGGGHHATGFAKTHSLNSHNKATRKVLLLFHFTDEKERLRGAQELAPRHTASKW